MPTTSSDPTQPNYVRPELAAMSKPLTLVDDLLAGPERMWERSSEYVRKWKDESPDVYDIRRKCEPVFGGLSRTLSAAAGMLFAKEPAMVWNQSEAQLAPLWDDFDGMGTKGTVVAKRFSEKAIRDGLALLLIDYTPRVGVVVTSANEAALGLRPTAAMYERAQAVNWYVEDGQLQRITLAECATVADGEYGIAVVERFRALRMVLTPDGWQATWTLWELVVDAVTKQQSFRAIGAGVFRNRLGVIASSLPVAIAYTGRTDAPMTASIPLADVAYANLAHWRYATNLTFNREVCAFEQLVITGELMPDPVTGAASKVRIGPLVGIHLVQGGTATYIGPTGRGLEQLEKGAQEKMVQMDQQGLGFLVAHKDVQQTATEAGLDSYAQLSTLSTAGVGSEDGFNRALEIFAWYEGIPKAGAPVLALNKDFQSREMDAGTMGAYAKLVEMGFDKEEVLHAMQRGGRVREGVDLPALALAWDAALEAKAAQAAEDAALQQDAQIAGNETPAEAQARKAA